MSDLLLATANPGKQRELSRLLRGLRGRVILPQELGLDLDVPEPHDTYAENAAAKASAYCTASGLPSLADDSGLEVAALDWGPGARSARHGGPAVGDRAAFILEMLNGATDRRARMVCWLALAVPGFAPDGTPRSPGVELFSGLMDGAIADEQRGSGGFGYDPIFLLPSGATTAELPEGEKDAISHRGRAVAAALPRLRELADPPMTPVTPHVGLAAGHGVVVILPTYNERENLERMASLILEALPEATLLVVDDSSPDGTGILADTLAGQEPRVNVLHRPAKEGLGAAYRDAFRWALDRAETRAVVQIDADFSHDPAVLPGLLAPLMTGSDLVIGTRYMPGGGTVGWPLRRRLLSRAGTAFARTILLLPYRDLTGGFRAWRRELLEAIRLREAKASGYGFQIETAWWAHRRRAVVTEVPIIFRERVAGVSKMSGGIILEALRLVLHLRWEAIRDSLRRCR